MTERELLDPFALAQVKDYLLLTRIAAEGLRAGLHLAPRPGHDAEFFQYQSYVPGDDLRRVDWKVFARRDELHCKVCERLTHFTCFLVLDASASMDFRGAASPCTKYHYAAMVAACLAHLAIHQGDRVALLLHGGPTRQWIGPAGGRSHLKRLLTALASHRPGGTDDPTSAWSFLRGQLGGRGLVVEISDFWAGPTAASELGSSPRHDVLALQVLDPEETDLGDGPPTLFEALESTRRLALDPARLRQAYRADFAAHARELDRAFDRRGVDHARFLTTDSLGAALGHFLKYRHRLVC